ncbi:hypothetical protein D9M71_831670 [compost metagenome]
MQAGKALHFLHGGRGRVRTQEGIVALAVLVDLVGESADTPVFVFDDLAAIIGENGREMFDQPLGLRIRQVLAGDQHMLIERHDCYLYSGRTSTAGHPFRAPPREAAPVSHLRKDAAL